MQKLDLHDTMKDVMAAIGNVREAGKVGVVGYCWGGTVAWASATRLDDVVTAVGYFGGGIGGLVGEKPRCPVMLHFGDQDPSIPMDVVAKVKAAHPTLPIYVYHAGHGFNATLAAPIMRKARSELWDARSTSSSSMSAEPTAGLGDRDEK